MAARGGRGSRKSTHLQTWGREGQVELDIHTRLKFDKYLISNLR